MQQVALDEVRESVTLLKNESSVLPFDGHKIKTLVVIGHDAWPAVTGRGGSSHVDPYSSSSILDGLINYPGSIVKVLYARGLPSTQEMFETTKFGSGVGSSSIELLVKKEIFNTLDFTGPSTIEQLSRLSLSDWPARCFVPVEVLA